MWLTLQTTLASTSTPLERDFVATSESDVVLSFDPETLETKDRVSGRINVNGDYMTTALNCMYTQS